MTSKIADGLRKLADFAASLIQNGELDSELAQKLARRIRSEAKVIQSAHPDWPETLALRVAVDGLDLAVKQAKVHQLMQAMADLRVSDGKESAKS